jgi:hypothetical protein
VENWFHETTGVIRASSAALEKKSYFFPVLSRFFKATNLIVTVTTRKKRQRNGQPVTVTVAPLQLGTVVF